MCKNISIIKSITLGRTKAESICMNVLAPEALTIALQGIKDKYFAIQCDASNIKNRKFFPIAIQFFDNELGIVNKLLDFQENADESALGMFSMIRTTFQRLNLTFDNVSSFSADNCNANFGQHNSLFKHLCSENQFIVKANCHAHIIHNTVKKIVDNLDYDVENLILKVYAHFSVSAKKRETLKQFSEFNDIEYKDLLHHVVTRWLSLNPCIERFLRNYLALLSYFRSLRDCPQHIKKLLYLKDDEFENTTLNNIPEIYLLFLNNLLKLFEEVIKKLEKNSTSIIEIYLIFENLNKKLVERKEQKFFGYTVNQKLKQLDAPKANQIENDLLNGLTYAITYLNKWFNLEKDNNFLYNVSMLNLSNQPIVYRDMCNILLFFSEKLVSSIDKDCLFDEITTLNEIIRTVTSDEQFKLLDPVMKWVYIFKKTNDELVNLKRILGFVLSIPASTAYTERVFSIMGNKWSDVRNRSTLQLIKSELLITLNFDKTCSDFFDDVVKDQKLLIKCKSGAKYA